MIPKKKSCSVGIAEKTKQKKLRINAGTSVFKLESIKFVNVSNNPHNKSQLKNTLCIFLVCSHITFLIYIHLPIPANKKKITYVSTRVDITVNICQTIKLAGRLVEILAG